MSSSICEFLTGAMPHTEVWKQVRGVTLLFLVQHCTQYGGGNYHLYRMASAVTPCIS